MAVQNELNRNQGFYAYVACWMVLFIDIGGVKDLRGKKTGFVF
jgi:hypothetical protein